MTTRPTLDVPTPPGGWLHPWPNVAELATRVGPSEWMLVGGLMVALHAAASGRSMPRATVDVDAVIHVEASRGAVAHMSRVLGELGYTLLEPADARKGYAHRFARDGAASLRDVVDVMTADHVAPGLRQRLRGFTMVAIDGGTQAVKRACLASLTIAGVPVELSVPDVLGATVLKAAAFASDSREPARHLADAAVLLSCMADPFAERERLTSGSDGKRLRLLAGQLSDPAHPAWIALGGESARDGQAALRILLG